MSEGSCWPEQDAVDSWLQKHGGNYTRKQIMELKDDVTKFRIEIQNENIVIEDRKVESDIIFSYFVFYRMQVDSHNGYGRTEIKRDTPILSIQDIEGIEEVLSRKNQAKTTIESWRRFEQLEVTQEK